MGKRRNSRHIRFIVGADDAPYLEIRKSEQPRGSSRTVLSSHETLLHFLRETILPDEVPARAFDFNAFGMAAGYPAMILRRDAADALNAALDGRLLYDPINVVGGYELVLVKADVVDGLLSVEASYPSFRSDGSLQAVMHPVFSHEYEGDALVLTLKEDVLRRVFVSTAFMKAWKKCRLNGMLFSRVFIVPPDS